VSMRGYLTSVIAPGVSVNRTGRGAELV